MSTQVSIDGSRPPSEGIVRQRSIDLTIETIPQQLLARPLDNAVWHGYAISSYTFETFQEAFKELPSIYVMGKNVAGKTVVGKILDEDQYQVAMPENCLFYFKDASPKFKLIAETHPQYDASQPTKEECNGIREACDQAGHNFVKNAVEATLSRRYGRGLDGYFCRYTDKPNLLNAIKWSFLQRDIKHAPPDVLRRFLQYCVFISLHTVDNLNNASSLDYMTWNKDEWLVFFYRLCAERIDTPEDDSKVKMQQTLLLQAVFESAMNKELYTNTFDTKSSAKDNIGYFGSLISHNDELHAVPFGSIDESRMKQYLQHCKIFEGEMFEGDRKIDIQALKNQICDFMPISSSELGGLPTNVIFSLQQYDITGIQKQITHICGLSLSLNMPEYKTLAFFCSSIYLHAADDPLHKWAASSEGSDFFGQTLKGFQRKETMEQLCLRVLALVGYGKLLPYYSDMISDPVQGCYLAEFGRLLKGEALDNTQTVLLRMATSLRRAIGDDCNERFVSYFDMIKLEPSFHSSDGISDKYWQLRALRHYDHLDAWDLTWG